MEEFVEDTPLIPQERAFRQRTVEEILDVSVFLDQERIAAAVEVFPQERTNGWSRRWKHRAVDQMVDFAIPQ